MVCLRPIELDSTRALLGPYPHPRMNRSSTSPGRIPREASLPMIWGGKAMSASI